MTLLSRPVPAAARPGHRRRRAVAAGPRPTQDGRRRSQGPASPRDRAQACAAGSVRPGRDGRVCRRRCYDASTRCSIRLGEAASTHHRRARYVGFCAVHKDAPVFLTHCGHDRPGAPFTSTGHSNAAATTSATCADPAALGTASASTSPSRLLGRRRQRPERPRGPAWLDRVVQGRWPAQGDDQGPQRPGLLSLVHATHRPFLYRQHASQVRTG